MTFLPEEKLIFKIRPHIIFLVLPLGALGLFWGIYISWICPLMQEYFLTVFDSIRVSSLCILVSCFAFLFVMLVVFLDWWFNRLYLTNFRLIRKRGIIGKKSFSMRLDRIEDVAISYGFWGWLFCFGCLEVESAGHYGQILFKGAPWPGKKKWLIEKEIMRLERK